MLRVWMLLLCAFTALCVFSQKSYKPASVLATGEWYKLSLKETGVYKVDVPFLLSLGVNVKNIPSSSIRLFGNGGQMLPESCSSDRADDLLENALEMFDGGDGVFNGPDYFLFFAPGPHSWIKDSANQRFQHRKNLYSDNSFYFLSVSGTGKRITQANTQYVPGKTITSFNERYYHELDSVNFFSSGKQWFGEEFASSAGKSLQKVFTLPISNIITTRPATLISNCIARSVNGASRFSVMANNSLVLQQNIAAVTAGNLDLFARNSLQTAEFFPSPQNTLTYNYQPAGLGAQGWLDWFEVHVEKDLSMAGASQVHFRDWKSISAGSAGKFQIRHGTDITEVWDVTDAVSPVKMKTAVTGGEISFVNDCSSLHEYIAFNNNGFLLPSAIGRVVNQNLHASSPADLLIVTHPDFLDAASRLAAFHTQHDGFKGVVVTTEEVYNEFSSGSPDPSAIRDFVKMYYDKASMDSTALPKYLLLFGDASYDYKDRVRNNTNMVPAYQSPLSLDPLASYTSDDYFGFLGDDEDINSLQVVNLLDIGIGRIPAKTKEEADAYVDKVINYNRVETLGPWRNHITIVADDEDFNLHLHDAEVISSTVTSTNPDFIEDKIYLDAFKQESSFSGSRYSEVNKSINERIESGTLIWNYSGHGGSRRLSEEVILDQEIVNSWNNPNKLPLFITATCDFAPFDNPASSSLGEHILLKQKTGAIALMTTTRLVFAYSNRIMNRNYLLAALQEKPDGTHASLGEAVQKAKNTTYQSFGDITNNRKFTLLGDPALTLAFPRLKVLTQSINDKAVTGFPDTLRALTEYTVKGDITDQGGNLQSNFTGTVYPVVYDKEKTETTLSNDPGSLKEDFFSWKNILFKGKANVVNGKFQFTFMVPKDINYQPGNGRISYYAENGQTDANGNFTGFIIGGSQGLSADTKGPDIKAYLNDENFVNGSVTHDHPVLFVTLSDSSGINITRTSIGHDITAVLDNDPRKTFVLNDFFETGLNTYQKGLIRFQLPVLNEGDHTLKIKAWDAANNSTDVVITFRVTKKWPFTIRHLMNFPNPFTSKTTIRFEHDLDAQNVLVAVSVFTVFGKMIKSIQKTINTGGNRSCDIEWDGKNDYGADIHKGIYFYRVRVSTVNGTSAEKSGKLVIQ